MTDAPDFGNGYPSGGKLIGPAWRAAWSSLSTDRWTDRLDLLEPVAAAAPVAPDTLWGLLRKATQVGLLSVDRTRLDGAMVIRYRISDPLPSPESLRDSAHVDPEHLKIARVLRAAGWTVKRPQEKK